MTPDTIPPPNIKFETDPRIVALNEKNRRAAKQTETRLLKRLKDFELQGFALERLREAMTYEQFRSYSLFKELETAETFRATLRRNQGQRGRAARTPNAFVELCTGIVRHRPGITLQDFISALEEQKGLGVVADVDEEGVHYQLPNRPIKTVSASALKSRLSRIKKKLSGR